MALSNWLGNIVVDGTISKVGGTNIQFLKADGSIDTNSYQTIGATHYIGSTLIANNRGSGTQTLTGISIDGNAASATSAPNYLPLAGGILTGAITINAPDSYRTNIVPNYTISSNAGYSMFSPLGNTWHNIYGFAGVNKTVTFETSVDNSVWVAGTLNNNLFAEKENQAVLVLSYLTQKAVRWTITGNLGYATARWLQIGFTYTSVASNKTITLESSIDGVTWTQRYTITGSFNATLINGYTADLGADGYHRLTILWNSGNADIYLSTIKYLSNRSGDQGMGPETSFPYTWDGSKNVTFSNQLTVPKVLIGSGSFLTNSYFRIGQSVNAHIQGNIQNANTGTLASSDWVATANNGTDTTNFINMGINGSTNADPAWTMAGVNDGYMFINGGHLTIGTTTTSKDIKFFTGGTMAANEKARMFGTTGNFSFGNTTDSGFKIDVTGTARISGATTLTNLTGTGVRPVTVGATGILQFGGITTIAGYGITDAVSTSLSYFIGTTTNTLNRVSGAQTLTGVSIDGSAGSLLNASYVQGTALSGGWGGTNGISTGAFNAVSPTNNASAFWLLSGSTVGVFKYGIQGLDSGGQLRFYEGANQFTFAGNVLTASTFSGAGTNLTGTALGLQIGGNSVRQTSSSGYQIGSYNSSGANGNQTNPIYTIGSAYVPTDSSLVNMYGVGFSHDSMWGAGKSTGWGLYVVANGIVKNIISESGIWTSGIVIGSTTTPQPVAATCTGEFVYFGSGTTVAGNLYLYNSSGAWVQCNASTSTTSVGLLAIAQGTTPSAGMLVRGQARFSALTSYSVPTTGQMLWAGTTAGAFGTVPPTATTQIVRVIGYCIDATNDIIYFNPDNTWVEIV